MLSVAKQPLSSEVLIDAVAVDVEGRGKFDQNRRLQEVSDILEICVCLVDTFTDRGQSFVQIAHFSVLEYLQSDRIKEQAAANFALDHHECHLEIVKVCIIYVLDSGILNRIDGQQDLEYSPLYYYTYSYWVFHYLESGAVGSRTDQLVVRLLTNTNYWRYVDWDRVAQNEEAPICPLSIPYYCPIYIAIWLGLNCALSPYRSLSLPMRDMQRIKPLSSDGRIVEQNTPQALYARFRLALALINTTECFQLSSKYPDGNKYVNTIVCDSEYHQSPLQLAAALGSKDMVLDLLDEGYYINDGRNCNRLTPIQAALGKEDMTRLLIKEGADVNAYGLDGRTTALHLAVLSTSEKTVKILLRGGAYVDIATKNMEIPLALAIKWSSPQIVSILLDGGADISLRDRMGQHALQIAAARGSIKHLQTILSKRRISRSQTAEALEAAASAEQIESLEFLLQALPALRPNRYASALVSAAAYGHPTILKRLLQENISIDAEPDGDVGNALHAAAASGHYDIVELLLQHDADINVRSGYFSVPLIAATARGWHGIVRLLLSKGADVIARNDRDENALQIAISTGRRDIAALLKRAMPESQELQAASGWHRERAWELKSMTIPFGSRLLLKTRSHVVT